MATEKSISHRDGAPMGKGAARELAEQFWITMTGTADLVRKLTALADRYEAIQDHDDTRTADRRQRVAALRSTAESGRRLIRALAPPALPLPELAAPSALERADRARSRDVQASRRDAAADARDERASERDVHVRAVSADEDLDWAGRFLAACDRDAAAGDRADALTDRRAAQADRELAAPGRALDLDSQARRYALVTRLDERAVVRQAQGILMARAGLSAGEAFETLLAATGPMTLDRVADHVVRRGQLPGAQDAI